MPCTALSVPWVRIPLCPFFSGCSAAWERASLGVKRSQVQILSARLGSFLREAADLFFENKPPLDHFLRVFRARLSLTSR